VRIPPIPEEMLDGPDDPLGLHLFTWWVAFNAECKGIPPTSVTVEIIEKIRISTLGIDTEDARNAALEKALRLAATGDFARAGKILRAHVSDMSLNMAALDEAVSGKRRQRAIAKKRRRDGLQLRIEEIVAEHPDIGTRGLLAALRTDQHGGVIEHISDEDDGTIEWCDENDPAGTAPISGLKDRLSRAKKILKRTSSR
jgi:hypothetical protein